MVMENNSKNNIMSSLFWKFAERIGAQGVNLIVSIALARILAPEDYGAVALITIFIAICNVFIENGLSTALIQKKDADDLDFSSVFYCNIAISTILYIVIFLFAPVIAEFYGMSELTLLIRVLGISILIAGLKSIQNAYVSRKMIFKKFFICTSVGTVGSAVVGIWMAYNGYGVWALVVQQLFNTTVDTLMLWITVKWRPIWAFSMDRLKKLFHFGWKMLCSALLDRIYNELYGLVIGRIYNSESLAYYNKGNQFPAIIAENINGSISSVMLPALSNEQEDENKVKSMMSRSIKLGSFILFPLMVGLAVVAEIFVRLVLTDKWLPAVPLMQLLCFSYIFWPIHTVNLQAISAMGRSDIYLKLEIIKKVIGIVALLISCPFGITVMAVMKIVTSIVSTFINSYPNKKLLNYTFKEQLRDILPAFWVSIAMGAIVYAMGKIVDVASMSSIKLLLYLILQIVTGAVIYIGLARLFKFDSLTYLINSIKGKLRNISLEKEE